MMQNQWKMIQNKRMDSIPSRQTSQENEGKANRYPKDLND